jgi:hypothetical protein
MPFLITKAWIHEHATWRGTGWTKAQLDAIGIEWPPRRGWIVSVTGTAITDAQRRAFEDNTSVRAQQLMAIATPTATPVRRIIGFMVPVVKPAWHRCGWCGRSISVAERWWRNRGNVRGATPAVLCVGCFTAYGAELRGKSDELSSSVAMRKRQKSVCATAGPDEWAADGDM